MEIAGFRNSTPITVVNEADGCERARPSEDNAGRTRSDSSGISKRGVSEFFQDTVTTMIRKKSSFSVTSSEQSRSQSTQENYNDSTCSAIARSDRFQHLTLFVIVLNAIWIGIDTEWNHKYEKDLDSDGTDDIDSYPLEPGSIVIENLFCLYFFLEVVIRFFSFRVKRLLWKDGWFVFDSILVFFMVLETWIMTFIEAVADGGKANSDLSSFSALRLMRLLRLTRLRRLMQRFPELMVLIKGIISSTKAVGWILLFLLLVMYVYAILMTSLLAKPPPHDPPLTPDVAAYLFGSLGDSLMTLFTQGVLGDNLADIVDVILEEGVVTMWIFWSFFGISSVTLLNMLIGVLCCVIGKKADEEREIASENDLRRHLEDAFSLIDINVDGVITEKEFEAIKDSTPLREALAACGIDDSLMDDQLRRLQGAIFKNNTDELTLKEFTTKVLDLQPQRPASCLAVELLRTKQLTKYRRLNVYTTSLEEALRRFAEMQGLCFHGDDEAKRDSLCSLPTHHLLRILKERMRQTSHALEDCSLSAFPARTEESCFSEVSFAQRLSPSPLLLETSYAQRLSPRLSPNPLSPNPPSRAGFAIEATEGDCQPQSPLVSPRLLVRQHPIFQRLLTRNPPGGWQAARDVARQLSQRPLELLELSESVKTITTSDLQELLDALPEMFEQMLDKRISAKCLEEHLQGCPVNGSPGGWVQLRPCSCLWRLCDALLTAPQESPSNCNLPMIEKWPQPPELLQ